MLKTLGVVEISADDGAIDPSFQGPSFTATRRFRGASLLEWIARRVTDSLLLDKVIVLAPLTEEFENLENFTPPDVSVFRSDHADPLGRFVEALREFNAKAGVRIHVDNPLIDPTLIDRLVASAETHSSCDYATYCRRDGRPALASMGMFAEWCSAKALRRADKLAALPHERQDVAQYLRTHPETFQLRLLPAPAALDRDDLRLSLRRQEDWDHVQQIFDALDFDNLDWQSVAELIDQQPDLRHRMAALNQAEAGA